MISGINSPMSDPACSVSSYFDETVELVTQVEAQKEIFVRVTSEGTLERLAEFPTYQLVYLYMPVE